MVKTPHFQCWGYGFDPGSDGKEWPAMQETHVQSLGWEDPLEKGMATHASILAWRLPSPLVTTGLFSMSVSLFPLYK